VVAAAAAFPVILKEELVDLVVVVLRILHQLVVWEIE
tara:strand:- start:188 stop:298 length:111 start_codon:yes stop_codon:yes gene_type:complete